MAAKRQRVDLELPDVGQAALPAVCYLPSVLTDGTQSSDGPSTSAAASIRSPAKRLKYSVHAKARVGSSVQLVHAAHGDIEYVGRSDGDENAGVQPCRYALGVYNPGTGKLQLVNIGGDRLFRLDTRLQGLVYAPTGAGAEEDADNRDARKMAAKRLVDEFGSTRRRRQMTAREAGVVAADRISGGEAVQQMLGGVATRGQGEGLTRQEMQRRAFAARTVPPHDPAATSAAAAYPLQLLLGAAAAAGGAEAEGEAEAEERAAAASALVGDLNVGQIHALAEDEEKLATAREKELLPAYVLSRLPTLRLLKAADSPQAAARVKSRARYLALLAALLRLQSRHVLTPKAEGVAGLARELRVKPGLAQHLLDKFCVRTEDPLRGVRYERPEAQKQLLLSYILAAAVVAEEGFMDKEQFEELRAALKMDATKMSAAMQELGCVTKGVKHQVVRGDQVVDVPSFTASLLKQNPNMLTVKTLQDCFPAIKIARGKGGGK